MAFSLLVLLAFFPLILGLSEPEYHRASGLTTQPYLWRWLAVTGVLFAGSAVLYALRCRRASSQARKQAARTRTAAARTREQAARTREPGAPPTPGQPAPAARHPDDVPSPAAPSSGFDVWHPARPGPGPRGPPITVDAGHVHQQPISGRGPLPARRRWLRAKPAPSAQSSAARPRTTMPRRSHPAWIADTRADARSAAGAANRDPASMATRPPRWLALIAVLGVNARAVPASRRR